MLKHYQRFAAILFSSFFLLTSNVFAQSADSLLRNANDPIEGNPKGKVTVVEFFDYQCSHCVNMAPVIKAILAKNPDVRIVFKEFPIRGEMSDFAARAALAANNQGKYYQFNHALLTADDTLTPENVLKIAKNVGLNVDKLKKEMESSAIKDQLKANLDLGQNLNVIGTPAFFIGKTDTQNVSDLEFVLGEMKEDELQSAIDRAGR